MKFFTKSVFAAIALMAGVTTANAQDYTNSDEWVELEAEMWHQWANPDDETTCTKGAEITGDMTPAWNLNSEIGAGACILGAENVTFNLYADISEYEKLIIFGAGGPGMRVMCNREKNEGAWKNLIVGFNADDPHWDADLECLVIDLEEIKTMPVTANNGADEYGVADGAERTDDYVHLHCFKNAWGGEFPTSVSAAYLWKAGDSTGIKEVKEGKKDNAYYNLAGQRIVNPTKGLFIQNGKKVLVK